MLPKISIKIKPQKMNKLFLCTRVKHDTKTQKGGVCTIVYSFNGEKIFHISEINVSKRRLTLLGILKGLEALNNVIPAHLQIDGKVSAELREQIRTGQWSNETEDVDLIEKIRGYLSFADCVFRNAKDHAGKAMVEKATFYAAANVGVGYLPCNETPIVFSGPAPVE